MVKLVLYKDEKDLAIKLIKGFWFCHNQIKQTDSEAEEDLNFWTSDKHRFYFITYFNDYVGFIHLGSRGCNIDWLEDIFVIPEYQGKGIGSQAIYLVEEIVKEYSVSLYIEAAARNEAAIRLYRKLGFDCLNTITIRKDFPSYKYEVIKNEKIYGLDFEIRKTKK
jgi:GNAT superfamily N-acetyltransferase